jgi:non-ribosomal peptide synthetase component F
MTVADARRTGLGELLRRSAARAPASTAVRFGSRVWTYRELLEASEAAAGALARLGVEPGDRVAVLGRNSDTYLITWLATQLAGAIHVPVNFMLNAREVAYIVEHSGAKLALADEALFHRLAATTRTATLTDFQAAWDRDAFTEPPPIRSDAVAQIAYTSGTESAPKGAMLTHEGLLAQYVSCIVAGEYAATDVMLHALPLAARLRPRGPRTLQGAQVRRLPRRASEEPEREDPQARTARDGVELTNATAVPHGSRVMKPPSMSSASVTRARISSTFGMTTVQWRRPTACSGAGPTPGPRQMLKPRWWW